MFVHGFIAWSQIRKLTKNQRKQSWKINIKRLASEKPLQHVSLLELQNTLKVILQNASLTLQRFMIRQENDR